MCWSCVCPSICLSVKASEVRKPQGKSLFQAQDVEQKVPLKHIFEEYSETIRKYGLQQGLHYSDNRWNCQFLNFTYV